MRSALPLLVVLFTGCTVAPSPVDDDDVVAPPPPPFALCINEFMPANSSGPRDEAGEFEDWIELHNPTADDAPLAGLRLSDDPDDPDKHVLPDGIVPAGGYALLWADGEEGDDHLGFALNREGGTLSLFDAYGRGNVIEYGAVGPDSAIARASDCCTGGCLEVVPEGTPGASNERAGDDELVRRGDFWVWTSDPPAGDWTGSEFDDSAWGGGSGPLGYGGDWHVESAIDPPVAGTTWLRGDFRVLQGASAFRALRVELLRDGGAAVYLNGVEIVRSNLPDGPLAPNTRASSEVEGQEEFMYFPFDADPTLLVEGRNQVAVELHRSGPNDTDGSFDLAIIGRP